MRKLNDDQIKMLAEKFGFQTVKRPPSAAILTVTTVLSCSLVVLLHRGCLAFSLRIRHMVESRSIICVSAVYPCIDPDGGGNGSLTAGMHPLPSTRLCFDSLEHRHLR